ncbi:MAG: ribbon-helix-helix domain-containing protein [Dehalococcoidia bacterium]|nr:ribbon-helix-helix domain-containing protein [Dehalococcoidia bacterium]
MRTTKVAISINRETIEKLDRLVEKRVFPSRSSAIQEAIDEKLTRFERIRLAEECAKLDSNAEQALAEEGLSEELVQWPEY